MPTKIRGTLRYMSTGKGEPTVGNYVASRLLSWPPLPLEEGYDISPEFLDTYEIPIPVLYRIPYYTDIEEDLSHKSKPACRDQCLPPFDTWHLESAPSEFAVGNIRAGCQGHSLFPPDGRFPTIERPQTKSQPQTRCGPGMYRRLPLILHHCSSCGPSL